MIFVTKIKSLFSSKKSINHCDGMSLSGKYDFFEHTGTGCIPSIWIDLSTRGGFDEAYNKCEPLNTIIGRNSIALANAKWQITDRKNNDKSSKYPQLTRLLKRPNPIQSWTEFIIQLDTYRQLYGEVFVFAAVGVGLSIQDAYALWVIKPEYISIKQTNKLYSQHKTEDIVDKYLLNIGNQKEELNKDHVLHIKDVFQNLNFCPTNINGKSRLVGLENPIKNIIQTYEAIYALTRDRGALGILSNNKKDVLGNIPITPKEKDDINRILKENYGLLKNQMKVIVTDADMKWQQMSFNVKELMLFEGIEDHIKRIADAFGYPFELLSTNRGTTFNNKKEAKEWHYQDTIIPIAKLYAEKLTSFFNLTKEVITPDFSRVEVLKRSEVEKAEILLKTNQAMDIAYEKGVISREEWRLRMGFEEIIYGKTNTE